MSTITKRKLEYLTVGTVGLILVISGIFLLSFNWTIALVLFSIALGIPLIYYYLTSLRVKLKIWRLIPNAQACVIFLVIIISAIVIVSTVSIIL
ncbi:MAG: hypothetical protein ACXAAI_11855 [Promethearchaeota archaeon]